MQPSLLDWLNDPEIRTAYAVATLHYDLAHLLSTIRTREGVSRHDLARRTGFSEAYIANLERGGGNPPLERLATLFASLGLQCTLHVTSLQFPRRSSTDEEAWWEAGPAHGYRGE